MEGPPRNPDDWTEDQWIEWLEVTARAPSSDDPMPVRRPRGESAFGSVIGAAMMGLERAMFGERPTTEVVVEAASDDPNRDASVFDPDDPAGSTLRLAPNPDRDGEGGSGRTGPTGA